MISFLCNCKVDNYFIPFYDYTDVREIFNCKDFAKQLPGDLSFKYQKNIIDALKGFFNWLREERLIPEVPVMPSIEVPEYEPHTISKEIQIKILAFIPEEHKPIFTFLFYQGCRIAEVCALKWDSIAKDVITYKRTFSGRRLKETTKTRNIRHNLLFPKVKAVLPKRRFLDNFVFTHGRYKKKYYTNLNFHVR